MNELTPAQIEQAGQIILGLLLAACTVIGMVLVVLRRFDHQQPQNILSSSDGLARSDASVSSDQTAQTADQTAQTAPEVDIKAARRERLLTIYRAMRVVPGMTREQARAILQAIGEPLDNNLWAEAKPEPKEDTPPVAYTPIAGRPYNPADYYDDEPQLRYVAPKA